VIVIRNDYLSHETRRLHFLDLQFSSPWDTSLHSQTPKETGHRGECPALRRIRQEDPEFKATLGYMVRTCLKNKNKNWWGQRQECSKYKILGSFPSNPHPPKNEDPSRCWWLTLIILATQEAEIRKITVQGQARQIVCKTLSQKYSTQNRAGGVAQEVEQLPSKCEALSSKVRP
jgi:hypothetical protein